MALRVIAGCCIFAAGWYVVDKAKPGILPRIDVSAMVPWFGGSPTVTAIELRNDTKDPGPKGTAVRESLSTTQGAEVGAKTGGKPDSRNARSGGSLTERIRSRARQLPRSVANTLALKDVDRLIRASETALQSVEFTWNVRYTIICLLLACVFYFIETRCCGGGRYKDTSEDDTSPISGLGHLMTVDGKSNYGVSKMAHANDQGSLQDHNYNPTREKEANHRRREAAAATLIQRWTRSVFKRWLQQRSSRSSVSSPSSGHGWIDRDYGALAATVLECPGVDALVLPGRVSDDALSGGRPPKASDERGGDDANVHRYPECRKRPTLSSAQLSSTLLKLFSPSNRQATREWLSVPR